MRAVAILIYSLTLVLSGCMTERMIPEYACLRSGHQHAPKLPLASRHRDMQYFACTCGYPCPLFALPIPLHREGDVFFSSNRISGQVNL